MLSERGHLADLREGPSKAWVQHQRLGAWARVQRRQQRALRGLADVLEVDDGGAQVRVRLCHGCWRGSGPSRESQRRSGNRGSLSMRPRDQVLALALMASSPSAELGLSRVQPAEGCIWSTSCEQEPADADAQADFPEKLSRGDSAEDVGALNLLTNL